MATADPENEGPELSAWIDEEGELCLSFGPRGGEPEMKLDPESAEALSEFIDHWVRQCRRQSNVLEAKKLTGMRRLIHPGTQFLIPRGFIALLALAAGASVFALTVMPLRKLAATDGWPSLLLASALAAITVLTVPVAFLICAAQLTRRPHESPGERK